ncbi:radical SAM/SPASM domain-containing protein [Eubacterium oxidoreducens]|uniref:Radical SAM superfamily enzyme, MoaA/NifB/PqqE/SkfB family n=1 Tax=Eubacterium oxidoreducens TaxID=1732 RepID=A0A1G6B5C1_EUBOX|nr:radical SAM protein [Eubacterium oxidoreducens]SDB15593.1 Radical SAM superfamily enzyme, MoaA/NifB/PqqE/SkfB family [Eubacterium oxidoreducens]
MDLHNRRVIEKMRSYNAYITKEGGTGIKPRGLIINYSNACNFNCQQCFTESPTKPLKGSLTLVEMKKLADEADALGMYEILIEGGEPLVSKEIYDLIQTFGSDRFYLEMTTNGYLLTPQVAKKLKEAGLSRVSISIDSMDPKVHDEYRGTPGAYEHAIKAMEYAKEAGMQVSVNFLVGHYNIHSGEIEQVCEFCQSRGYHIGLQTATPTGNWQGKFEIMTTPEDAAYLEEIRHKYKHVWRDIWPPLPNKKVAVSGCVAVNRPYINPYGDVLPCSYMHMKLGNIKEQSLKEILDIGFSYECFRNSHKKCYAAEDPEFMKQYCMHKMSILEPIDIKKVM